MKVLRLSSVLEIERENQTNTTDLGAPVREQHSKACIQHFEKGLIEKDELIKAILLCM